MLQAKSKNIMLIGRSRTGKSTIKMLLVNPTAVPEDLELKSGTKDPLFETFHIQETGTVLNIIDTPGLFERGKKEDGIRDNEMILKTIKICVNREITKFHFICFCASITSGINQQDIESLKILTQFLGRDLSRNSCLIVTHCESKNEQQRKSIREQLSADAHFVDIASFFKLGIFFSGSINRDDYNKGNQSILGQFKTSIDYRSTLIDLFNDDSIEPFQINSKLIKQLLETNSEEKAEQEKLIEMQEKQLRSISELKQAVVAGHNVPQRILDGVIASTEELNKQRNVSEPNAEQVPECTTS